jgi:hypothetical protein
MTVEKSKYRAILRAARDVIIDTDLNGIPKAGAECSFR